MVHFLFYLSGILPPLGIVIGMIFLARRSLHYLQLESYQLPGYFKTLRRQFRRIMLPCVFYTLACIGVIGCYVFVASGAHSLFFALWQDDRSWVQWTEVLTDLLFGAGAGFLFAYLGKVFSRKGGTAQEKKPFVVTTRVKRLYAVLALILLLCACLLGLDWHTYPLGFATVLLPLLLPLCVALAALCAYPMEKGIQRLYFKDAEKKLMADERLIRIGITGSYGKTSTKFILATVLSQKFNVLATPASFNTPMGVTRVIRERLSPSDQVFIGEMGARHVGEIKELCGLVHPKIGILTSVGPQHLDTFGAIERIEKTKYELIEALPEDGLAVFLDDGDRVTRLYEKTTKDKRLVGRVGSDAWAENVTLSPAGATFTLCLKGESPFPVTTRLLGAHSVSNILLAATVAQYLGLSARQIALGIGQVEPVEHRMKIVSSAQGVTVIDDAFNTNPRSSKEALETLSQFPGRRIIVTPGMVELGAEEARYNEEFGREMAGKVDIAVLIGKKHAAPIQKGLLDAGFKEENLFLFDDLTQAVAMLNEKRQPGDVILYENDLPDHYA